VSVKRSAANNTIFAFVAFENVDMALGAKKEVAGQYFGRLQVGSFKIKTKGLI
jgi:hypothetical protein